MIVLSTYKCLFPVRLLGVPCGDVNVALVSGLKGKQSYKVNKEDFCLYFEQFTNRNVFLLLHKVGCGDSSSDSGQPHLCCGTSWEPKLHFGAHSHDHGLPRGGNVHFLLPIVWIIPVRFLSLLPSAVRLPLCLRSRSACLITAQTTATSTESWKVCVHLLDLDFWFHPKAFLPSCVFIGSGLTKSPGFMEFSNEWLCLGYGVSVCKWW